MSNEVQADPPPAATPQTGPTDTPAGDGTPKKSLSPAAQRALAEAAERRSGRERAAREQPKELQGRGGLDPVRYGDWEVKGVASDF